MITYRAGTADDVGFIVDSFCHSFRMSPEAGGMNPDHYYPAAKKLIKGLLARDEVEVTVASPEDDPGTILGWAAVIDSVVLFAYVKRDMRRLGIAKAMLKPKLITGYTFRTTPLWDDIVKRWKLEYRRDIAW